MKKLLLLLIFASFIAEAQPSRWYSYPSHYEMLNGGIGDTSIAVMWNKRNIRINGMNPQDTVWMASNAIVLHPQISDFNDINYYPGQMAIKPTNEYQLDSVLIRGYYQRNQAKPSIVDTIRLSITYSDSTINSNLKEYFFSGSFLLPNYGVDTLKFLGVTYDSSKNYSKKVNALSPNVIVVNYLLNTSNQYDTVVDGYNVFKIDIPNVTIPANGKCAVTTTYISGDTYAPFDTVFANGNVKYNYFAPMYIKEVNNSFPNYYSGDYNSGNLQLFGTPGWSDLYIPMFGWNSGNFSFEIPSVDIKLTCPTCDNNIYQIYKFGTSVFQDTITSCNSVILSTLGNTTISGVSKQWMKNGVNISGATTTQYSATQSGIYELKTTINGVVYISNPVYINITSFTISIVASSNNVCAGGTVTITASGAPTVSWIPTFVNGNGVTVLTTTTYTVTGTNSNGCTSTSTVTISISPVTFSIVPLTSNICIGDSLAILASGTPTFAWSGGITNGVYFTPTVSSQYTVTATSSAGCTKTSVATVTVNPLPTPIINSTSGVLNTSIPFSSYQWFINGTLIAGATSSVYTALQNGMYSVKVTNANNCKNTSSDYLFIIGSVADNDYQKFVTLFPNPAMDFINVNFKQDFKDVDIKLYNTEGTLLKQFKIANTKNCKIDIKELASGFYLLHFNGKDFSTIAKIAKQ